MTLTAEEAGDLVVRRRWLRWGMSRNRERLALLRGIPSHNG